MGNILFIFFLLLFFLAFISYSFNFILIALLYLFLLIKKIEMLFQNKMKRAFNKIKTSS